MYARLVTSAAVNDFQCMRDIGRLITSANPSIADLSGQGYSTSLSSIVDATPAGWTYVGSNKATDQPTIGGGAADATWTAGQTTFYNLCFSAPMQNYSSRLKYAVLKHVSTGAASSSATYYNFALIGAQSASSLGVLTNEGYNQFSSSTSITNLTASSLTTSAAVTHHVIANARHITIIQENRGVHAVWETTSCELNDRFNTSAFVQYSNATASKNTNNDINTVAGAQGNTAATIGGNVFNAVNLSTGTSLGVADCSLGALANVHALFQISNTARANSIDAIGFPRYQISPIYLQMNTYGWPIQFVSGVVPAYWTRAGIGSSGDTVSIGADSYTFFNAGANGTATFGLLIKTS